MSETIQNTLANGDVIFTNIEESRGSGNKIFDTKTQPNWGCSGGNNDMCSAGAWIDCRTSDMCAGRRMVYSTPGKKVRVQKFTLSMAGGHSEGLRTGACSSVKVYYWDDAADSFKSVNPNEFQCNLGNGMNHLYTRDYDVTLPKEGTSALGFEFQPDMSRPEPNYLLQEMKIEGCIAGTELIDWGDDKHTYFYTTHQELKTHEEAHAICVTEGGVLAPVTDGKTQGEVKTRMSKLTSHYGKGQGWWGLTNIGGGWRLTPNGKSTSWLKWRAGEPNNGANACGWSMSDENGWDDAPCSWKLPFVCRVET
jgi:hypothetical protein